MPTAVITATEIKSWCKIDTSADDAVIDMLIQTAQSAAASYTGLTLDPLTCPPPVRQAIAVLVADLYANREGKTVGTACFERLLNPFRVSVL